MRKQIQQSVDFVYLCCHAVPSLKGYIKAVEKKAAVKIPDPDHFKSPGEHDRLLDIIPEYKKTLGKFFFLNSFSYFESYIKNVFEEIFTFHGGVENFLNLAKSKRNKTLLNLPVEQDNLARKLREEKAGPSAQKYQSINLKLENTSYSFPSDLFAFYGIHQLSQQINSIKASMIPDLVQNVIGVDLSDYEISTFHQFRDRRNKIAHGMSTEVDLAEAINANKFLRELAIKIDQAIIRFFLVVEV